MKKTRAFLIVAALVALCAGAAQATPIDPVIIVRGGTGSIPLTSPTMNLTYPGQVGCTSGPFPTNPGPNMPAGASQYFGLPSMTCEFHNNLPGTIYSVQFNITSAQLPLTLLCGGACTSFTQTSNGGIATFFFSLGIPNTAPEYEFAVDFINFDPNNTNFTLIANPVPEPGTLALMGAGLLGLAARLRRRRV